MDLGVTHHHELRVTFLTALAGALGAGLITVLVLPTLRSAFARAGSFLWTQSIRAIFRRFSESISARRYKRRLAGDLRKLRILGMSRDKDLANLFVPLRLAPWVDPSIRLDPPEDPEAIEYLDTLVRRQKRLTILGYPGAGKTTLTTSLLASFGAASRARFLSRELPIFISLRELQPQLSRGAAADIETLALTSLENSGFRNLASYLERKLRVGRCVIVLDGFDELADSDGLVQQRLASAINRFSAAAHQRTTLILTSRPVGYEPAWFRQFATVETLDLKPDAIESFVRAWFGARDPRVRNLHRQLRGERLGKLASNPLMLAIICFVCEVARTDQPTLPTRRSDLYERCVHALVEDWDRSRGLNRTRSFSTDETLGVLRYIAYVTLERGTSEFHRRDLLALVDEAWEAVGRVNGDSHAFVREVENNTGLLRQRYHDYFSFAHLTFHEYLAAEVISDAYKGTDDRSRQVVRDTIRRALSPEWVEPVVLAASVLRGGLELLMEIYDAHHLPGGDADVALLIGAALRDSDLTAPTDEETRQMIDVVAAELANAAFQDTGHRPRYDGTITSRAAEILEDLGTGALAGYARTRLELPGSPTRASCALSYVCLGGAAAISAGGELVRSATEPEDVRFAAIRGLGLAIRTDIDASGRQAVRVLADLAGGSLDSPIRDAAAEALLTNSSPDVAVALVDLVERGKLSELPEVRARALLWRTRWSPEEVIEGDRTTDLADLTAARTMAAEKRLMLDDDELSDVLVFAGGRRDIVGAVLETIKSRSSSFRSLIGAHTEADLVGAVTADFSGDEQRFLQILSQFDEPIDVNAEEVKRIFADEGIEIAHYAQSPHVSLLLDLSSAKIGLRRKSFRDFYLSETPQRLVRRVNSAIAEMHVKHHQYVSAARYFVSADNPSAAVELLYSHRRQLQGITEINRARTLLESIELQSFDIGAKGLETLGDFAAEFDLATEAGTYYGAAREASAIALSAETTIRLLGKEGLTKEAQDDREGAFRSFAEGCRCPISEHIPLRIVMAHAQNLARLSLGRYTSSALPILELVESDLGSRGFSFGASEVAALRGGLLERIGRINEAVLAYETALRALERDGTLRKEAADSRSSYLHPSERQRETSPVTPMRDLQAEIIQSMAKCTASIGDARASAFVALGRIVPVSGPGLIARALNPNQALGDAIRAYD